MIVFSAGSLYNYGLERCFTLASEAGFDGIEIIVDYRWDTHQVHFLSKLSTQHNLPIASFHSPFTPHGLDGWGKTQKSCIERTVKVAEELGARVVTVHLPARVERDYARWLVTDFGEFASRQRVTVTVENMPVHHKRWWLLLRPRHYVLNDFRYWERFQHLTLDTTHLGTMGLDVVEAYERLKDRVAHVHLSNFHPNRKDREHHLPDDGILPLDRLLRSLWQNEYGGVICLEVAPRALGAGNDKLVLENLRKSLAFCREHFASPLVCTPEMKGMPNAAC